MSLVVACVPIDDDGAPLGQSIGVIRDLSQGGAALEVVSDLPSEQVRISFIDAGNQAVEIPARVRRKIAESSGKTMLGISFEGSKVETAEFLSRLVKFKSQDRAAKTRR